MLEEGIDLVLWSLKNLNSGRMYFGMDKRGYMQSFAENICISPQEYDIWIKIFCKKFTIVSDLWG